MSSAAFRQLLEAGDIQGVRRAWKEGMPGMPQPVSDEQAEIVMHMTRTAAKSIRFKYRAYSHRWLTERLLPSQLPDDLKPRAERMYPVVAEAVGISVKFSNPLLAPAAGEVQRSMERAVEEAFADGQRDPVFVKGRMLEARDSTLKSLFGGPR